MVDEMQPVGGPIDLYQFIPAVVSAMMSVREDQLIRQGERLAQDNHDAGGNATVLLGGIQIHAPEGWGRTGAILPQLAARGDALVREWAWFEQDRVKLRMGLTIVLKGCKSRQDVRDALPNPVVKLLADAIGPIWEIPRTRPEGWNLPPGSKDRERFLDLAALYGTADIIC